MAKKTQAAVAQSEQSKPANQVVAVQSTVRDILAEYGFVVQDEVAASLEAKLTVIKPKKVVGHKWAKVPDQTFGAKTPTQMRQCVECLPDEPVDMKQWVELLAKHEGFKTQQPIERIIAWYKGRMIKEGLIRVAA